MLSEEALILIAAAGALALLLLGVLELVWPSKPRHPVRRATPPAAPVRPAAPPSTPPSTPFTGPRFPPPTVVKEAPPARKRRSKVSPHARPHARRAPAEAELPGMAGTAAAADQLRGAPAVSGAPWRAGEPEAVDPEPVMVPLDEIRRPVEREVGHAPVSSEASAEAERQLDPLLVETCFSLYQDRCYDEVVSVGESALGRVQTDALGDDDAHEVAALWSVVALAKQAQDDDEGAREALEAALAVAPVAERVTYRQHLAALALNAAQTLVGRANNHEADDRVGGLRAALAWVERGLEAAPADARLREVSDQAQDALWPAYEQTVNRLLQRQEFEAARQCLGEALDDPALPSAWLGDFQDLLAGTFGGEIGQLTAQAIRSMQEEREPEALLSLQRAEELLATISEEALPPKRREEVDQRLWWGYTRLGMRRVEAEEFEEALDPLVHALRFGTISPDRQAETRVTLVRALEGVADLRARAIRQLCDDGHRDEAQLRTEALHELLRSCMELGISEDDLSVALATTRRLTEELDLP